MSLIELLVSVSIFAGLMTAIFVLLNQNQRAAEKSVAQADASAAVLLIFEKIRSEMRTGRVVNNTPPEILEYWVHERTADGSPVFGGPHGLVYLPGAGADPDVAQLRLEDGRLIKNFQGRQKMLAAVGKEGTINFNWSAGSHILLVSGEVNDPFEEPRARVEPRKYRFVVSLNNVE